MAIFVGNTYQIGMVTKIFPDKESYKVRTMTRRGKGGAALTWPTQMKEYEVSLNKIITKVQAPQYSVSSKNYRLMLPDVEKIKRIMK